MTIGFDAKRAFLNNTGLGNYCRTLIETLCQYYPDNHYYAFSPKVRQNLYYDQLSSLNNLSIVTSPKYMPNGIWRSFGIKNDIVQKRLDVYHGLSNELPFNARSLSCKKIVTIHDLIFEEYPELYPFIDRKIYHLKFKNACINADKIIAISAYTKQQIIEKYSIPAHKIDVVYQDAAPMYKEKYTQEQLLQVKRKYELPDEFILQVGTLEYRKNALTSVKALLATKSNMPIVLVGKPTTYTKEIYNFIEKNNLHDRVYFRHNVTYSDLPLIYQQAKAFVYGSRIEGFGIPILEALYSGIPVIAATGSCLQEAGGSESLYFHPDNFEQLASLIDQVISGAFVPNKAKMEQHLMQFDQSNVAPKIMNIYQS